MRMGIKAKAISMTRSDSWTTSFPTVKPDKYKQFCTDNCPHKDTPCNGDCPEMKEFRKLNKRRNKNGV